ncbi:30S ribosomal protein S11 [Candidatus Fokinia solitaria]|uniref:Small ribosomal subunit protein uS11 n=1 Tax=Candidatus Fokinia solitaria TaxID=1802984 RepID=A0A2U8BRL6_9RICK|nr:30S ribosomal protein S11 [Candidatus Fokinia solitaria]AWD32982.1 30S ribosomal protein S11 [Candidatus Fokinia solitaria]
MAKKVVYSGIVHVVASFNNTYVCVTDLNGCVIAWSSSGANNFKGSKKSTPYAAQIAARSAITKAYDQYGLRAATVKISGPGAGRESAVRAVAEKVIVTAIEDRTPVPHNGTQPPKRRRI